MGDVRKEEKEASVEKKAKLAKKEMKKEKEKVEAEKTAKIKDQIAAKKAAEKVPNKKKKKRDAWGAYIDSLEPTGLLLNVQRHVGNHVNVKHKFVKLFVNQFN